MSPRGARLEQSEPKASKQSKSVTRAAALSVRAARGDSLAWILVGAALLGMPGCASSGARACPPLGLPAATSVPRGSKTAQVTPRAHAPLERLATSVEALECAPGLESGAASEALSNLAEALEVRSGPADTASQKVRMEAWALASSSASSAPSNVSSTTNVSATTSVREGLEAALDTLLAGPEPARGKLEYREALAALRRSLGGVVTNDDASCAFARDALRAATNAVFLALASEPPFERGNIAQQEGKPLTSMRAGIEPARAAVLALGDARWSYAREPAAQALRSLAAMMSAGDCAHALSRNVSDLRLQAERLALGDSLSFGQTHWIKSGLVTALDGLELVAQRAPGALAESTPTHAPGSPWVTAARQAVANIDAQDLFTFQRSAIQDAFRATLDAFTFIAQQRVECQR